MHVQMFVFTCAGTRMPHCAWGVSEDGIPFTLLETGCLCPQQWLRGWQAHVTTGILSSLPLISLR